MTGGSRLLHSIILYMYNFVVITRAASLTSLDPETPDLGEKDRRQGRDKGNRKRKNWGRTDT